MTFEQIEKVLFGGVGLTGWQDLTVSEVLNAYAGYFDRENERTKLAWEVARWQEYIQWNLHVTKKSRITDPKKLIKFEWDKKGDKIDPEKWEEINSRFPEKLRNGNK